MLQDALSGVLLTPVAPTIQFACALTWSNASSAQKQQIPAALRAYITNPAHGGYTWHEAADITTNQSYCAYVSGGTQAQVTSAWRNAWNNLNADLHAATSDPRVSLKADYFAMNAGRPTAFDSSDDVTTPPHREYRDETLEEKKKRAMDFLTAQGLGNFGITNGIANGIA